MKIALIGRPNVGKSTLFNRLFEKRHALETAIPGTTRDINCAVIKWKNTHIELMDTPGLEQKHLVQPHARSSEYAQLEYSIQLQAQRAMEEADIIVYMIDFTTGILEEDRNALKMIRRKKTPVILVINKVDSSKDSLAAEGFEHMGFGVSFAVSAINGRGTDALLDHLALQAKRFKKTSSQTHKKEKTIRVAIVGKPNVGKSSLFNALLAEERVLVSPLPHTTRDPNNTEIVYKEYTFALIDTAGLRKKARVYASDVIEIFSVKKTLETIKNADVTILMVDCQGEIASQDRRVAKLILDSQSTLIIVGNKWDRVPEKTTSTLAHARSALYDLFKSFDWAPIVFTDVRFSHKGMVYGIEQKFLIDDGSQSNSQGNPLYKLLDLVIAEFKNYERTIPQKELHAALLALIKKQSPSRGSMGKRPHIRTIVQTRTRPPTFTLSLSSRAALQPHYIGYITNFLRSRFALWGTPIIIKTEHE